STLSLHGALPIAELCVVGKPVLFIPSPNVAEDHQAKNALALSNKNAAVVIRENELEEKFREVILQLLKSVEKRNELSENIKKLALPGATKAIVDEIEKLVA